MDLTILKNAKLLLIISFLISANTCNIHAASLYSSASATGEGLIGVSEETPIDNPFDNIFHVDIPQELCGNEEVWLTYELEGVADHTSVSRSINDQVSFGGYLVKVQKGWRTQREQVNAQWLRQGDNVLRFTVPESAKHNYRIRNISISIEREKEEVDYGIALNQPSYGYYNDKAYVKGFVKGRDGILKIEGEKINTFNGEFEHIICKPQDVKGNTWEVEMEVSYKGVAAICQTVTFTQPLSADYQYDRSSSGKKSEKFFETAKAQQLSAEGASFDIDVSTLTTSALISITALRGIDIPPLDAGMVNVTANNAGYRFLPHGSTFQKEARITLPYNVDKIPTGYTEKDIKTYFFDEQNHHWVPLPLDSVHIEGGEIWSKTTHFTDMINGIIQVPESPEANAYNSTSMKGIKAANPTAAINLMQPPSANNMGNANMGYPLNLPAGRNGMQPQLAINYNNGGGNSWMGLGWNLSIPTISIDTRWGAPRYDEILETETYSLNGQQLSPVAHRGTLERRTSEKRFYPRVEGAFQRIIRHGSSPSKYWWEVTDKSGTRYLYGGTSEGGFEENAVLNYAKNADPDDDDDEEANKISQWNLAEVIDLNGNNVRYYYEKVEDSGIGVGNTGVPGYEIYCKKIVYTGRKSIEGKYSVHFYRDLNGERRRDVAIDARLGFKHVTAGLLEKVEVKYEGNNAAMGEKNIRHYDFKYEYGAFFKNLLTEITEYDAAGKLFTNHTLDYYNEVKKSESYQPFKETFEEWKVDSDNVKGTFKAKKEKYRGKVTALSGTRSDNFGFGMGVGVGFDWDFTKKSSSVTANFGYSRGNSYGTNSLIDINGDGLPDKIFLDKEENLYYKANLLGQTGEYQFSTENTPIRFQGNNFYKESSRTLSGGLQAQFAGAFVSGGYSNTKSKTTIYMDDVNADGLPDIIDNGKVWFNILDKESGEITFSQNSALTESKIEAGENVQGGLVTVDPEEIKQLIAQNPLHDVVRVWKAPYAGKIAIDAPVRLLRPVGEDAALSEQLDGVNVKVQVKGNQIWNERIKADDFSTHNFSKQNIQVKKGDAVYFRVQSVENGFNDKVQWSPSISYMDSEDTILNTYGKKRGVFNSATDHVLSGKQEVSMPYKGQVVLKSPFLKKATTDHIQVSISLQSELGENEIWSAIYAPDSAVTASINETINVDSADVLRIQVFTNSNIDWSQLEMAPYLYYSSVAEQDVQVFEEPGNPGSKPLIAFNPVPDYLMYSGVNSASAPFIVEEDSAFLKLSPVIRFKEPMKTDLVGQLTFTVKKPGELVFLDTIDISQGDTLVSFQSFSDTVFRGETYYFEFYAKDSSFFELIKETDLKGSIDGTEEDLPDGFYSNIGNTIFGNLYQGWGQFAYNGNLDRANSPINEQELNIDRLTALKEDDFKGKDYKALEGMDNGISPSEDNFIIMLPYGTNNKWNGYDRYTLVDGSTIQSSRFGLDEIPSNEDESASGGRAVKKITITNNLAFTAGYSVNVGVDLGASGNTSFGPTKAVLDFRDMNGDRYPDIVAENKVQYTNSNGGLAAQVFTHKLFENVHDSYTTSFGAGLSGSAVTSEAEPSKFNIGKVQAVAGNGKNSVGLSGNYGEGKSRTRHTYLDINGDGLPDRLIKEDKDDVVQVALNLGYSFGKSETWGIESIQNSESKSYGGGLGVDIAKGSISAGIGVSFSENHTGFTLMDINSDGLADMVYEIRTESSNQVFVRMNQGGSFSEAILWAGAADLGDSRTAGFSASGAFTIGFPISPLPLLKIVVNPSTNYGASLSRQLNAIRDVDGDGNPDYVESINDGQLKYKSSTIGRTNMLKTVSRPLGASFTLSYERIGNTYDQPNSIWTLSGVEMFDGFAGGSIDGVDTMRMAFAYENGFYERHEREFYGFEKVTSTSLETDKGNKPYTIATQTFDNSTYYRKGLLLSETMTDAGGKKYVEKTNTYILKHPVSGNKVADDFAADDEAAFPALTAVEQQFYEGKDNPGKTTRMTYEYSEIGNVIGYTDAGDEGGEDDLTATIDYHDYDGPYIKGSPSLIIVDGTDRTYRKREASIDPATGNVTRISQYLEDETVAVHSLEYDEFGNLKKITRPANHKGERLSMEYTYDTQVNTYVTKVSNSYGYSSEASYDFRFGQVLQSIDLNGNKINYELDDLGRVTKIKGPYEQQGGQYTLQFEYFPHGEIPWALTKHYDPLNKGNHLETAIFVDGLGRVLQTKKDIAIYQGEGKPDKEMMAVSGRTTFDAFGRTVAAYYPVQEDKGNLDKTGSFVSQQDNITPTTTSYDALNRALSVTLPDKAITQMEYGFASDRDGKKRFRTRTTDANGITTEQFTDVRGRVTAVKNITSDGNVWTSFVYNAINEQIAAINDMGNATLSEYDQFGRRIQRIHPDAGTTTYSYDLAGNLTELLTANLKDGGGSITYAYDHERLTDINYPLNMENDVHYTYGDAGAEHNRAGRIVLQEDASGAQEFFYGPLGEVVKNLRTIVIPKHTEQTYETAWVYDTWNRLVSMTYPDGEEVNYHYNAGGLLRSMDGKKGNAKYDYVSQLGYDKFEQRVFLAYGNGTKTNYTYEPERRRLQNMTAATSAKRNFMDNTYGYDKVNNILSLKNNAEVPNANLMGGSSEYTYEYDDLYRLTSASGKYTGSNEQHHYSLSMSYNSVGGILQKTQLHERSGSDVENFTEQKKSSYDNTYAYSNEQPHAPVHIGQQAYTYDANGNQTGWKHDVSGQRREILWDEENRIRSISDNGAKYHYVYDASGTRVLKGKSIGQSVYIDGSRKAGSGSMGNYTVYASPYLVLKSGGYTKHYYIEGQRIVSKLGGGMDEEPSSKAGNGSVGFAKKHQDLIDGIVRNLKFLGEDGSILTAGNSGKIPPGQIKGGGTGGDGGEKFQYFYHPDHLGSTSYITDASGEVYQHLEYFAFGGTFVEEHSNTDRTPYLFNGKELDEETGLYYYGARYYDEQTSIWLSVDPLAEKFPNWSPYAFCYNNPINVIDPDGREGIVVSGGEYNSDDRYKYNFIEPAITRLKELKSAGGDEQITWAVMTAGYSDADIEKLQSIANDLEVGFQSIGSADEFTNYLNSKDIGVSDLSEARSGDQITSMSVFGHGFAGSAELAYNQDNQASFSWSTDNVSQLNKGAFNNATIDLYTCNSATNTASGSSLGSTLSARTGSTVTGYRGQSTYRHMNIGEGWGGKINRKWNGFNTNGSQRMPQAGEGASRIRFVPKK